MAGYSLTFDNVQFRAKVKHQTTEKKKTFHMFTMMLAAKDRVTPSPESNDYCRNADELDVSAYCPIQEDYDLLREDLKLLVQRLLVEIVPFLDECEGVGTTPPHAHADEMARKSDVVNLGVLDVNPSGTGTTTTVLDHLRQYVPVKEDKPVNTVCH